MSQYTTAQGGNDVATRMAGMDVLYSLYAGCLWNYVAVCVDADTQMTCLTSTDGKLTICRADGHWEDTKHKRERWCFGCRKRRLFVWRVFVPDPMSWYGPQGDWFCPNRDEKKWVDHTDLFPGWSRSYEEDNW